MSAGLSENYACDSAVPLEFCVVHEAVRRNQHRTPLLLIDPDVIRATVRRFRAALPTVALHYAVKANPHPWVLQTMVAEGVGFEVASTTELETLLAFGVDAREIHFNNPVKPPEQVSAAARLGVRSFVIDSVDELRKVAQLAQEPRVCLRVETGNVCSDWPLTGKFGATMVEAQEILDTASDLHTDVTGVAFHVGSQCRNLNNWQIGIENAKRVFEMMRARGIEPRLLNIGGGFPVQHRRPIPSIEEIGVTVNQALAGLPDSVRVMAEPGRFLVGTAAWLIAKVTGTAVRRGTRWIYLDAGVYHGLLETLGGLEYDVRTDRDRTHSIPCTIAGPTCDSTDVVARDEPLPEDLQVGDYVYVPNAGAYTTAYRRSSTASDGRTGC